ncbi:MAG: HNH endonuclease [Planctomycetota bacterium]
MAVQKLTKRQIEYRKYLQTKRWKLIRYLVKVRDKRQCVKCGSRYRLDVHHKSYRNLGRGAIHKETRDCETLCRSCHRKEHGI